MDALVAAPVDKVVGVLDAQMKAELPRVTNQVLDVVPVVSAQINREMKNMSAEMTFFLVKKVDRVLDDRIRTIVDEELDSRLGNCSRKSR